MINKEQLKADGYAIEYWFNVYHDGKIYGYRYSNIESILRATCGDPKPLYRIHVRLK